MQLVLPWSQHADLCEGLGTRHGLVGSAGNYVNRFLILELSPPPYFIRKQFSLSNIFFSLSVNYIIGHSWFYAPIYADTVLHINCSIKTCQMGKKTQLKQNDQIRLADAYIIHVCLHCV